MNTPSERVAKFVARYQQMRGLDQEQVYAVGDGEGVPIPLLVADLLALTASPAQARKGLTDAEIDALTAAHWGKGFDPEHYAAHRAAARAYIKAAHGIAPDRESGS